MKKRLAVALLLSLTVFLLLLPTTVSADSPSVTVCIEITEENADKAWTAQDLEEAGVTGIFNQSIIEGIDGTQYWELDVYADRGPATMAMLFYRYNISYCEYFVGRHPIPQIPEYARELGENGEVFRKDEIVLLFKEDTYTKRTKDDFSFLNTSVSSGRNEALGITWVILHSGEDWGVSMTTASIADMLYDIEGVVFSQPSIWMYSAYGEVEQGDVNFDGMRDTSDARNLLLYVVQDETVFLKVGDLDSDGSLSTTDARIMLISLITQ